jgi:hypothetical protein
MVSGTHDEVHAAIASLAEENERSSRNQRRAASVNEYKQDIGRCVFRFLGLFCVATGRDHLASTVADVVLCIFLLALETCYQ